MAINIRSRLSMVAHFFREQYYGSIMGPLWLVLEPIVFSSIVWFFFFYALKASRPSGAPFSGWLLCGMAIWILSATMISAGPSFIKNNFHLARMSNMSFSGMIFSMQISSLPVHGVFILILVFIDAYLSDGPSAGYLLIPIFMVLQLIFAHAFMLLLAVLGTFFRDIQSAIGIVMQVMMWSSPIFWDTTTLPKAMVEVMNFNPLFLLISGYRCAFFGLEFPGLDAWIGFISVTVLLWAAALFLYQKTKKQLGDHL